MPNLDLEVSKKSFPLIDTNFTFKNTSEKYCCEIVVTILADLRKETYDNFVKADEIIRDKPACDLSFEYKKIRYYIEHSSISAYKQQHEDQALMQDAYESNQSIKKTTAKIIEPFKNGPGGEVTIDKKNLEKGSKYRKAIYKEKITKLMLYDGIKILVIQNVDISAIRYSIFYNEILELCFELDGKTIQVSNEIDYICYVASGHKEYKYWVIGGVPIYFWQRKIPNKIIRYVYYQKTQMINDARNIRFLYFLRNLINKMISFFNSF